MSRFVREGVEGDHQIGVSRRQIMATSASAILADPIFPTEATDGSFIAIAKEWLTVEAERVSLLESWVRNEARLHRLFGWVRLTPSEQALIPDGAILQEIDSKLDLLNARRDDLLSKIMDSEIKNATAAVAAILVVEQLVQPEDSPEASCLLSRAANALLDARA